MFEQMKAYGANMNQVYTAVTKQDDGWWIGWIEEVPGVNCQDRRDALSAVGTDFREE